MIYIIFTVFIFTAIIVRIRRGLSRREALYLFLIIFCAGVVVRSVLFALGM